MKPHLFKVLFIIIIVIYITVFAFNWNRLQYGVEISDEAYYVAEAYIVSNGAIPFTDNWLHTSGTTLLYWPLIKLYTMIYCGTEGIFLFMRQAFLIYKLLVATTLVILFKRRLPFLLSMLIPLPYIALSSFSIANFSYNNLSLPLLLICVVLLFLALQEGEKYSKQFSLLAGIFMALTILAHPMQLFVAVYIFVLLLIFEARRFKAWFRTCLFVVGGIVTGCSVFTYLSIISGGVKPIFIGISNILQLPCWNVKKIGLAYNVSALINTLVLFSTFLICGGLIFIGLFSMFYIGKKGRKGYFTSAAKTLASYTLFLTQLAYMLIYSYRYRNYAYAIPLNATICCAYVLILLLFVAGWKAHGDMVLLIFSPFAVNYLLYIPFHQTGISGREYILFPSVMLCIALTYFALEGSQIPKQTLNKKSFISYACAIVLTVAFVMVYMVGYYGYVYRDASLPYLTYKIEKGIYKGLYTVEERGKALIYLEDEIKKTTNEQDKVLFMDQAPQAYMMTNAEPCTPSTWDIMAYSYAYAGELIESYDAMDDFLWHEYFKATGKEPSKIIYVQDKERLEHLSLWNNDYRFNQYVKRYYTQVYSNNAKQFAIIVFERNCQ